MNWRFALTLAIYFVLGLGYPATLWYLGTSGSPEPAQAHSASTAQYQQPASPISTDENQPSSEPAASKADAYTYNYYYPTPQSRLVTFGQIAAIGSAILLTIFTGGLWITSIWQWRAIDRQARIASDSLRIAQRAMLGIQTINFQLAKKPIAAVVVINYGRSPATNVRPQIRGYLDDDPPERTDYVAQSKQLLPPVERIVGQIIPDVPAWITINVSQEFSDAWIKAIQQGKMFVYIIGKILYHDGFEETELPLFCYCMDIVGGMMRPVWRPPAGVAPIAGIESGQKKQ